MNKNTLLYLERFLLQAQENVEPNSFMYNSGHKALKQSPGEVETSYKESDTKHIGHPKYEDFSREYYPIPVMPPGYIVHLKVEPDPETWRRYEAAILNRIEARSSEPSLKLSKESASMYSRMASMVRSKESEPSRFHSLSYLDDLVVRSDEVKGRGVYADNSFRQGQLIERCPVVTFTPEETKYLNATRLSDYLFRWNADEASSAMALGLGSLYNHSTSPNAAFEIDPVDRLIRFFALTDIEAGEEVLINYYGHASDGTKDGGSPVPKDKGGKGVEELDPYFRIDPFGNRIM